MRIGRLDGESSISECNGRHFDIDKIIGGLIESGMRCLFTVASSSEA